MTVNYLQKIKKYTASTINTANFATIFENFHEKGLIEKHYTIRVMR